jgi:hypothetical protein
MVMAATVLVLALAGTHTDLFPWNERQQAANAEATVARVVATTGSLATSGVPSFRLEEVTESWPANSGIAGLASYRGPVRSISTWWYASPKRWRISGRYLIPPRVLGMRGDELLGGTSFVPVPGTVVSDGRDIWRYYRQDRMVQVERILPWDAITQFSFAVGIAPFGQSFGNLPTLLAHPRKGCYGPPMVKGSATIAGRQVSVVDLGPALCLRGSASSHEAAGRAMIWVDRQTLFVLQYRLYDPGNPSKILEQTTVTSVRYHASIDARLLRFAAPAGTVIDDMRPRATAAEQPYKRAVARLARQVAFPLLAPSNMPVGLTWSTPRLSARDSVLLAFVPPHIRTGLAASRTGVSIVERRATAIDLAGFGKGAKRVAIDGAAGWFVETRTGHRLALVQEGTSIVLRSRAVGRGALIALAATFDPVAGGHAPVTVPGVPAITALRHEMSFPIFVPTRLPAGLSLQSIIQGDGQRNPPNSVEIQYTGRSRSLDVFESFAGCCLDQDLRKWVNPVQLPDGVAAHRLALGPSFGGLYLWWEQAGTFVSISSPQLKQRQLLRIAGSMSKTAML